MHIALKDIDLSFGGPLLLDKLSLNIDSGERIALLGRNGTGKTTLMRLIAGEVLPDGGEVIISKNIKIAYLPQNPPSSLEGTVFDVVLKGLGDTAGLLSEYHHTAHKLSLEHTMALMRKLEELQKALDHQQAWDIDRRVQEVLSRLKISGDDKFNSLSGGQKRRAMLARALVINPDLLLLDEPTNHLDIDSIIWLEEFLKNFSGALLFITHDRMFMANLANRVLELDRGKINSWPCDYYKFLERKAAQEEIEAARQDKFEKHLEVEEAWVRRGVQARRCRDQGRVNALKKLREDKRAQRAKEGLVEFTHQEADISGHLVAKIMHIAFYYGDKCLIDSFSTRIMREDKIGIIGPNGCGKTTFLKILLGILAPSKGKARLGTNLQIAYFDQLREQLDDEKSLAQNICGDSETVIINGKPRNVIGYLQDFLFSPDKIRGPVKVLSGGERNRLLLARLFTRPSNFLIMDEPTNDLDMETLELLEELLVQYPGTLIIVSHDRQFLNNVVTSTIVFEGEGVVKEYAGGYDDYLIQSKNNDAEADPHGHHGNIGKAQALPASMDKPKTMLEKKKLGFNETRELNALPQKIEDLENEQKNLHVKLADVNFYKKPPAEISAAKARLAELEREIKTAYERWGYLSSF